MQQSLKNRSKPTLKLQTNQIIKLKRKKKKTTRRHKNIHAKHKSKRRIMQNTILTSENEINSTEHWKTTVGLNTRGFGLSFFWVQLIVGKCRNSPDSSRNSLFTF